MSLSSNGGIKTTIVPDSSVMILFPKLSTPHGEEGFKRHLFSSLTHKPQLRFSLNSKRTQYIVVIEFTWVSWLLYFSNPHNSYSVENKMAQGPGRQNQLYFSRAKLSLCVKNLVWIPTHVIGTSLRVDVWLSSSNFIATFIFIPKFIYTSSVAAVLHSMRSYSANFAIRCGFWWSCVPPPTHLASL